MYALIMAGGNASRLRMGEKALTIINDRPLLEYILNAVIGAELFPIVITSFKTPYSTNYCRGQGIEWICSSGKGYVEDLCEAVNILEIKEPFFTFCADLPGLTSEHIRFIRQKYNEMGCEALSVWVPISVFKQNNQSIPEDEWVLKTGKIPAGVNILRGDLIDRIQVEEKLVIDDQYLALNINTRQDLDIAEKILCNFRENRDTTNADIGREQRFTHE
jgi:adenosylcobinamide-phosphate guanylyltransferase